MFLVKLNPELFRRGQRNFAIAFISLFAAKVLIASRTVASAIICKAEVKLENQAIRLLLIRQFNV